MKLIRKDLLEALNTASKAVATKEIVAQSASFIFTENAIRTFNDEVAVSVPFKTGFTGAVPAKELLSLLNKLKAEQIELTVSKGELLLTGSKAKAGLRLEADINLPLDEIEDPEEWSDLPASFNKAVGFCLFSASRDQGKAILMNIHINGQFAESCDNYRITRYDMGKLAKDLFPKELLIPADAAKDIIVNEPTTYAMTDGWLHFKNDEDVTFSCRTFNAEYPDFTPFINCEGEEIEFPPMLSDIMDRASVLSDGNRVGVILEEDFITIVTENEAGWFEESIETNYKGADAEFDIQPEFMKSILKFKGSAVVGERVLRFESDNFIHCVQLMTPKTK